jgi:dipeptidyl aminopeptidase/acylaminoacyl peptidase
MDGRMELVRRLSPLSYVRKDGPAVLTIHGDADPLVPYAHALRLQQAMAKAGEKNQLFTIKGGGHGGFAPEQNQQAYLAVRSFLRELGIVAPAK